jgi:catechol 2,3-dioxygenase-like lactoylglutathione lyase family enzyme
MVEFRAERRLRSVSTHNQDLGGVMTVKRIIANVATSDPASADAFYRGIFGLDIAMDHGWIRTYASTVKMQVQISFASQGGSGTPVPDLSIEVDDLAEVLQRVKDAGIAIEYGPASEPWGVRRFYVRDPIGKLINVLQHEQASAT